MSDQDDSAEWLERLEKEIRACRESERLTAADYAIRINVTDEDFGE